MSITPVKLRSAIRNKDKRAIIAISNWYSSGETPVDDRNLFDTIHLRTFSLKDGYLISNYIRPSPKLIEGYHAMGHLNLLSNGILFDLNVDNGDVWKFTHIRNSLIDLVRLTKEHEHIFNTNEEIEEYVSKLERSENSKTTLIYPVTKVFDVNAMLTRGLFPYIGDRPCGFDEILSLSDKEYLFWYNEKRPILEDVMIWFYMPFHKHYSLGLKTCSSICLKHIAPNFLYKGSKRPVNHMRAFYNESRHLVPKCNIVDNKVKINGELHSVIPVTRYGLGMSKGLYYPTSDAKYKGTFYYNEMYSETYLAYKTSLVAINKTHAYEMLGGIAGKYLSPHHLILLRRQIEGLLPHGFIMTPQEYFDLNKECFTNCVNNGPSDIPNTKRYVGSMFLYGSEDSLDQPLCSLAAKLGYDIIILTHMVGSRQIVTEVLDVRERDDSYANLVYTY